MKNYILILFMVLGSVVLAQSKKERNSQLFNEMTILENKYHSTRGEYWTQHSVLETICGATSRKIWELEKSENRIKDLSGSILKKTNIFDDLGVDYSTILDQKITQNSAVSGALMKRLRAVNLNLKDFPNLDTLHLKDLKIAKKNEMMTKHLVVLNDNTKACLDQIQVQKSRIDSVQKLDQEVEAKLNLNADLTEKYRVIDERLDGKLKELETAYLTKGPKGFNQNYENYFPLVKDGVDESFGFMLSPAPKPEPVQEPEIFEVVDEPASFPGGMEALKKYLSTNLVYPQRAKDAGISGKVYLKFVISDKGTISNVKMLKGVPDCPECDKEAIRVVKSMPNWIPGKNKGKPVNSSFTLPVTFKL